MKFKTISLSRHKVVSNTQSCKVSTKKVENWWVYDSQRSKNPKNPESLKIYEFSYKIAHSTNTMSKIEKIKSGFFAEDKWCEKMEFSNKKKHWRGKYLEGINDLGTNSQIPLYLCFIWKVVKWVTFTFEHFQGFQNNPWMFLKRFSSKIREKKVKKLNDCSAFWTLDSDSGLKMITRKTRQDCYADHP